MRHGCIRSPWLFNVYMDAVMKDDDGDGKEESEISGGWESVEITWPFVCRFCRVSRRKT